MCFSLKRLCENSGESKVCFLPARATPFLHDFTFRLGFVILSKRPICSCGDKIIVSFKMR